MKSFLRFVLPEEEKLDHLSVIFKCLISWKSYWCCHYTQIDCAGPAQDLQCDHSVRMIVYVLAAVLTIPMY